jgi:hypothetical protein
MHEIEVAFTWNRLDGSTSLREEATYEHQHMALPIATHAASNLPHKFPHVG